MLSILESTEVDLKYIRRWAILNRNVLKRWGKILRESKEEVSLEKL